MRRDDGRASGDGCDRFAHVFEAGSEGGDGFLVVLAIATFKTACRLQGRAELTMDEPSGPSSSGGGGMMRRESSAAHTKGAGRDGVAL